MTSAPLTLPGIRDLPTLPTETREAVLDLLFEPSPALHNLILPLTSEGFNSWDELISTVENELLKLSVSTKEGDQKVLEDVLSSHPRLGEKKVESALSRMEQAAMAKASQSEGASEGDEVQKQQEAEQLRALNAEYEERFPGLRYV